MSEEAQVIESPDAEGEKLLQMAEKFDATGEYEPPVEQKVEENVETAPKEEEKPAAGQETPEKPVVEETTEGEPTEPTEIKPPETEYTKAQKEKARKEKSWNQIQAERERVDAEAYRIQQREAQLEAERQRIYQQSLPRATKGGFTAPEYQEYEKRFAEEGDYENAYKAAKTAHQLLAYEQQYYAAQAQQAQVQGVDQAFLADFQAAIQQDPEAGVEGTPLSNDIKTLFKEHPYLKFVPEGGHRLVEIAKLRLGMVRLMEVEKKLAEYEQKEAERQHNSQPLRGGPTTPGRTRSFNDMSLDEKERYLEHASEEADQQYGLG